MIHSTNTQRPSANITVNRNRAKNYGSNIYLKSGTHYEIELWNPTQLRVLARIEVDGKSISSAGIVLNPGQRVYLERWIDEPKKFLFSTYEAENSLEGRAATVKNGEIKVYFYDEVVRNFFPSGYYNGIVITNSAGGYYYGGTTTTGLNLTAIGTATTNTANFIYNSTVAGDSPSLEEKSFETGISEKGEKSSQDLNETSGDFNTWYRCFDTWQILPESQKPVEISKIRTYCTECGTRVRNSAWKFCPNCGEKF
jgi:hypothetical protein